jgi:putative N6-adenine-specific DNA methylase
MISNPPYGMRIGEDEEIQDMYEDLGNWMKGELPGFECWIISSNTDAMKRVGLRPSEKHKVFNGDLECSFRRFSMYQGSKKAKHQGSDSYDLADDNDNDSEISDDSEE